MRFLIIFALIVLIIYVPQVSAECNATIWGKIGFSGYNNSAAINTTIQIINMANNFPQGLLNSTKTDENGFYSTNIFFNSTSKNISVRIKKEGENIKTYSIQINCSDNISLNYSILHCPSSIFYMGSIKHIKNGNFVDVNETDEGEEVKIHLAVVPKDSKGVYVEYTNFTKTDESSSAYVLPSIIYSHWQTNLTLWAEPTKNYYYRVYDDENNKVINSPNYSSLISCPQSIRVDILKNFIRFPRKSVGENCRYNDECKSNFCNQTSHICECNSNADCAGDQICNSTHQCQNLVCLDNQRAFNHTCINCSSYDFDDNNITDIFDAVYILEYLSGEKKNISGCADISNNGNIDLFDPASLLYYLVL